MAYRGPSFLGGRHGLTIDAPGTGLAPLSSRHAHSAAQEVMHARPGAIVPPAPDVLIDHLPRGKIMRQQAPGTPTTEEIKNGVQDFPFGILLGSAPRLLRHIGGDQRPFLVSEVGRVRGSGVHAPDGNRPYLAIASFLNTL